MRNNITGIMKHAAALLDREAAVMRECSIIEDGTWHPEDVLAEIEHDEMLAIATALRRNAATLEAMPTPIKEGGCNGHTARD